jgi:hypothetical protein
MRVCANGTTDETGDFGARQDSAEPEWKETSGAANGKHRCVGTAAN